LSPVAPLVFLGCVRHEEKAIVGRFLGQGATF
jgi:hypothetical protein